MISFIVPLYNANKYIEKCLNSILNQGLEKTDYEVIVVDDGSTDYSPSKVEKLACLHPCIKLLNKEHGGVASARNEGLQQAQGEYICFVDADDYLIENGIANLLDSLDKNGSLPEIIRFASITVDSYFKEPDYIDYNKNELQTIDQFIQKNGFGFSACGQLINRSMIEDIGLRFENFIVSEDTIFSMLLYSKNAGKSIVYNSAPIYRYVVRADSAVNDYSTDHLQKFLKNSITLIQRGILIRSEFPQYSFKIDEMLNGFRRTSFTRLLAIDWDNKQKKDYKKQAFCVGLFPFEGKSKFEQIANFLLSHGIAFSLASIFYRYIFLPYMLKYVWRNERVYHGK